MTLYGLSALLTSTRMVCLTFTPPVAPLAVGGFGTVVLAPGVVADAGGGAAEVVPVAVVTEGAVSVRDWVDCWLLWDVLVVSATEEDREDEEVLCALLAVETLLIRVLEEIKLLEEVFTATLVVETRVEVVEEGVGVDPPLA